MILTALNCDDQPEFCDDQPDSRFFDAVGDEAVEVPEYVTPEDVPCDDAAAKEKAARYKQTKGLFNRGKGVRNSVGKLECCIPPIHIKNIKNGKFLVCQQGPVGTNWVPGACGKHQGKR